MSQDKIKKWQLLRSFMKIGMMLTLFMIMIQVGDLWVSYKTEIPDGDVWGFITYKKTEEVPSYNPIPSAEFQEKVDKYNKITRSVWIAIFFYVMFEIFSFKHNKEDHWVYILNKKVKQQKWIKNLE